MNKQISILIVLAIACIAFGRVTPKIDLGPDNEAKHDIRIDVHGAGSLHPHQRMIGFTAKCPLDKGEFEFRAMNVLLSDKDHVIAGVPVSVSITNGIASGSFMLSEDQIPFTRFTISYNRLVYEKENFKYNPVYRIDLKTYFQEYKRITTSESKSTE